MRDALLAQKRPMLYSLCQWGSANIQSWGNGTAQSWRATGDIEGKVLRSSHFSRGACTDVSPQTDGTASSIS
jgi:hypothetical protein